MLGLGCSSIPNAQAQLDTLRNGSFETWVERSKNGTSYSDPEFWYTLNSLSSFGMEPSTWASNDAKGGQKAAYLETTSQSFGIIPGLLACNQFLEANGNPNLDLNKIPFKSRPTAISFWHKAKPASGDSAAFNFTLTKFKNNAQQVIGTASWTKGSIDSTYQYVKVYFEYDSNDDPDSASIIFSSSLNGFDPVAGSTLLLDEIRLEYVISGLTENKLQPLEVYPNPSYDHRIYFNQNQNFETIIIRDIHGQDLYHLKTINNEINLEQLKPGMYFLEFIEHNSVIYTSKIILN